MVIKNASFFIGLFACCIFFCCFAMEENSLLDQLLDASDASFDDNETLFNPLFSPKSKKNKNRSESKKDDSCEKEVEAAVLRAFTYDMELIQSIDEDQRGNAHSKIISLLKESFQEREDGSVIENFYTSTLVRAAGAANVIMPRMNYISFLCNETYILEYYNNAYGLYGRSRCAAGAVIPIERAKNAAKEYLRAVTTPISHKKRLKRTIQNIEACMREYDALKK